MTSLRLEFQIAWKSSSPPSSANDDDDDDFDISQSSSLYKVLLFTKWINLMETFEIRRRSDWRKLLRWLNVLPIRVSNSLAELFENVYQPAKWVKLDFRRAAKEEKKSLNTREKKKQRRRPEQWGRTESVRKYLREVRKSTRISVTGGFCMYNIVPVNWTHFWLGWIMRNSARKSPQQRSQIFRIYTYTPAAPTPTLARRVLVCFISIVEETFFSYDDALSNEERKKVFCCWIRTEPRVGGKFSCISSHFFVVVGGTMPMTIWY